MIRILKDWSEVGLAYEYLTSLDDNKSYRVYHTTPMKNWDLAQIVELLKNKDKSIRILDMGCGGSNILRYCYVNKFKKIYGIDLTIHFQDRWQQLMYWKNNHFHLPYHLSSQDITKSNFPDNFFDILICLSVIEHNVSPHDFFKECARLLRKHGTLFLSTDYWNPKVYTSDAPSIYGAMPGSDWTIFSKEEIADLICIASRYGLKLLKPGFPKIGKPVIHFNTKKYTFLSIVLVKLNE